MGLSTLSSNSYTAVLTPRCTARSPSSVLGSAAQISFPFTGRTKGSEGGLDGDSSEHGGAATTSPAPAFPGSPGQQLQKIKAHGKNSRREELVGLTSGGQKQLLRLSRQEVKEEG